MPAEWRAPIANAAQQIDLHRVRVHAAGPAVLWAWRTRVLLPPDFDTRFDNDARRLVLHHELTHVLRGDALWLLIAEFACAALWFHPLAWLALPRFRLDQELACDERTLSSLAGCTAHYARALLDSAAAQPLSALIPWLAEPQLKERIAMISNDRPGALRRRAGFLAIAGLLCGGLLIAGGEAPVRAATHATQTSIPPSVDVTFKNRFPPHYPADAIHKGEQGTVILDVTVDAAGNVRGVQIDDAKTSAPMSLQTVSIQAAANWKFKPGYSHGRPVGGTVEVPVNFSLTHDLKPCPSGQAHASKAPFECVSDQSQSKSS